MIFNQFSKRMLYYCHTQISYRNSVYLTINWIITRNKIIILKIMLNLNKITKISMFLVILFALTECANRKSAREVPTNAQERARKNVNEGRGVSIKGLMSGGGGSGTYEFSTSNPMWRASLEILDFIPLSTVDYSGGIIISDWYNDSNNKNESIKITVRFLSNEIQTNSLKVLIHKKECKNSSCTVKGIKSKIEEELVVSILKKAAEIEKTKKKK